MTEENIALIVDGREGPSVGFGCAKYLSMWRVFKYLNTPQWWAIQVGPFAIVAVR